MLLLRNSRRYVAKLHPPSYTPKRRIASSFLSNTINTVLKKALDETAPSIKGNVGWMQQKTLTSTRPPLTSLYVHTSPKPSTT